ISYITPFPYTTLFRSLRHAARIGGTAEKVKARPQAKVLITEMDGSMVPIVQPGIGVDKRKGKKLIWREARLCCARSTEAVHPLRSEEHTSELQSRENL